MSMLVMLTLEVLLAAIVTALVASLWMGRSAILRVLKMCRTPWIITLAFASFFHLTSIFDYSDLDPWMTHLPAGTLGTYWAILEAGIWLAIIFAILDVCFESDKAKALKIYLTSPDLYFLSFSSVVSSGLFVASVLAGLLQISWRYNGHGLLLGMGTFGASTFILYKPWRLGRLPRFKHPLLLWSVIWGGMGISYLLAGRWGFSLVSLPAMLAYLIVLERLVRHTLPISPEQRMLALRAALSHQLGTNYPFYVIRDWKTSKNAHEALPKPCTPGNPFLQFFAGPGIVITDCAHAAVLNDGFKYRVAPPGLTFTTIFEQLFAAVDLRPQLRVTTIPAETRDGITTKTLVFMPHRIATGGKAATLGNSLPYDEQAILKAVCQNAYVEHSWSRDESGKATEEVKRVPWDELVLMIGPAILKDELVRYTCNELHDTQGRKRDPRVEIANAFRNHLRERMAEFGIETVGGGLSNIVPDETVIAQRIDNWAAKWKKHIEEELGTAEAEITRKLEPIWLEAQLNMYKEIADILSRAGELSEDVIALQLIEALGAIPPREVSERPEEALPEFLRSMMRRSK